MKINHNANWLNAGLYHNPRSVVHLECGVRRADKQIAIFDCAMRISYSMCIEGNGLAFQTDAEEKFG